MVFDCARVGTALDVDVVDGVFPCFCFLSGGTFRQVRNLGSARACVLLLLTD